MAYIRVRHACEVGESCPSLTYDTETGDALIGGPLDPATATELGLPEGEGVVRIAARDIPRVLHDIGPDTFPTVTS
ncbi:MAG: hypothetical protein ACRDTT_14485 [Pseudonocardiaceae bacterium]